MVEQPDQEPEEARNEEERAPAKPAPAARVQQEVFVDPSVEELHAQGEWLIGRRVPAPGNISMTCQSQTGWSPCSERLFER